MFCPKCGAELSSEDRFCSKCGASVNEQQEQQERQGSQIGGIDWKKYLTRENIEYLIAAAGIFPLVLVISGGLLGVLGRIYIIGFIFKLAKFLVSAAVVIAAFGAVGGLAYYMATDRSLLSPSGYLAAGVTVLSFVLVIIAAASKHFSMVLFLLAVLVLIAGLDVISRVFLQNKELASSIDLGRDIDELTRFIKKMTEQWRQQKAARDEERQAQARAQAEQAQAMAPVQGMPQAQMSAGNTGPASFFDGNGVELLGYMILSGLLSAVTLTIATPWTTCMILKWRKSHTVINGRRLTFTGTGGQMLGLWLKWLLLSLITLGIYAFFAYVDYLKWEAKHTFFDDQHPQSGAVNPDSAFDGNTAEFFGYSILGGLLSAVTLGIGSAWAYAMLMNWQMKHYVVSGYRMDFDGTGIQFLGTCIICALLCMITLGIYSPWAVIRMNKWLYSHTFVQVPAAPVGYEPPGMEIFN